ncbi:MAG: Asp-tRNA(Asn)/Glu-tRNA(Gln) amidotransferase subunit GatB, partial [Defluviicoccus sp.]|nr:Asp-tRNA(Asn)/Glu-tRNA(Gln) amidotransferase subunit GatB [Defluviicoccus sp.]
AMPGMLPVINEYCVEQAVRTGLGLDAEINPVSVFDRKNYFYPDLPQGYQISQYSQPIVGRGAVEVELEDGTRRTVRILRLHLEQDAGKSLHDRDPRKTWVDLNRAGVALMEIVTEPDMRSPEEAAAFMAKLRSILRYLGTCDGNMQEGSLRADVNVSVRRPGGKLGTRCEIKNLNSIRFIRQAATYEAKRQIEVIEGGGIVEQETRLFDPDRGVTRSMRTKEEEHDYRYFPDPDLMPLELTRDYVDRIRGSLPELPDAKKARFVGELGLSEDDADVLVADRDNAQYFEAVAEGRDAKAAANWVIHDLFGALNRSGLAIGDAPVGAADLGGLIDLIAVGTISGRIAKDVFQAMFETGRDARSIVAERGLEQVSDTGEIEAVVDAILAEREDMVAEYRAGKTKLLGFFVGQVMKATGGKANPQTVNEILRARLDGDQEREE